jgi:integrase
MASIIKREGSKGATWRVVWRTQSGAQRSKTFKERADAKRFRTTLESLEQAGQGPDLRRGDITLDAWAGQVLATLHLKPKTAETYASLLRSRISPAFGHRPLRSIERAEVRAWTTQMVQEVSPRRTQNAYALLNRLLNEAVLEGLLLTNPAAGVRLPRTTSHTVNPWTIEELKAVAHATGRYEPLILWLGLMGTRWAESIGLEWRQISGGEVTIDSSLSEVNGRFHRVSTKTYAVRRLPIPSTVMNHLPERTEGLVFPTRYGNPVRSAWFRAGVFHPACTKAGVRPLRIHDLRHTCASLLIKGGANPKMVQQWMGHQDVRMTLNTYTHLYASDLAMLAQQLDAA